MQMKSFKLFSLATVLSLNYARASICSGSSTQQAQSVIGFAQPGNVENCGQASQPLVYDNTLNGQTIGGFTPECVVETTVNVPGAYIPGQNQQNNVTPQPSAPVECVAVNQQQTPPTAPYMATTIVNPAPDPNYVPGNGTPSTPGSNKQYVPPSGTPPQPKPETQCTVTKKLDCDPVPGSDNNVPPSQPLTPTYPTPGGEHPPAQQVVPVFSVVPPPVQQKIYSVVQQPPAQQFVPPPKQFVPSNQPMVCLPPHGGSRQTSGSNTGVPATSVIPQPTCVMPSQAAPSHQPNIGGPAPIISSAGGTGVNTTGAMSSCATPQNSLNALCSTGNPASSRTFTSSNVGAACSLPNAEACLAKAIENVGKIPATEAASCALPARQPVVDMGMLVPASESYVQAWNSPCVQTTP